MTEVILVDDKDHELGVSEKMKAHRQGLLHRAFSVFIFDSANKMLLQRRAASKYHSAGLWSNACCSHPHPGEQTAVAAQRRLKEEMGFEVQLEKIFDFVYTASFENGLIENEFDHVFVGKYDGEIKFDPHEVSAYVFKSAEEISADLQASPQSYTAWFHIAFPKIQHWQSQREPKERGRA